MKRSIVSVAAILLLATLVPPSSTQANQIVPEPLPFSEDTDVFYIFGTSNEGGTDNFCGPAISGLWGDNARDLMFASNNPSDPCRGITADDTDPGRFAVSPTAPTSGSLRVHVYPKVPDGLPLVEGEDIRIQFTLAIGGYPKNPPNVVFGSIRPHVELSVGATTIGTWDDAPAVGVETMEGPGTSETYYIDYDVTLAAPATLPSGVMNLTVGLANDADDAELRRVATRVGFAIDEAHRGTIGLPISPAAKDFLAPPDDDGDDGDDGNDTDGGDSDGSDGSEPTPSPTATTPANNTTTAPTNTTASNNTTTAPSEQGFLPGFELVAVVSAALIALAYVSRERRRPPVSPRS